MNESTPLQRFSPAPIRLALVAALLLGGACLGAAAQEPAAGPSPDDFKAADKDHDGRLSEEEYRAMQENPGATQEEPGKGLPATKHQADVVRPFKVIDADHDGYIDADEMSGTQKR